MATPGQEDGPRALLEAGLVKRLEAAGIAVGRGGQVTLFRWRPDPDNASAANAGAVIDVPARSLPRGRAGTLEVARRDARAALKGGPRGSRVARAPPLGAGRSARRRAWAAGEAAVWVVTRIPVGGAAGQRACEQVRAAAGDGAEAVSRLARGGGGGTGSRAAAGGALVTTVAALQESAFVLLDGMLPTQTLAPAVSVGDQANAKA